MLSGTLRAKHHVVVINQPRKITYVTPIYLYFVVQWSGGMGVRGLIQSLWNLPEDEEDGLEEMEELMEVFEEVTEMELLTCEYGGRWNQSHATRVLGRFRRIVQGNEKPTDMRNICAFLMKHQKHVEDLL